MPTFDVDVLVAGGGPAGLLAAAGLAQRHRVALIDSTALGNSSKYLVTTTARLDRNGLLECLRYRAESLLVGTFLGGHSIAWGDIAVVDEELLAKILIGRCQVRGVKVVEGCKLLKLSWTKDRICAETTKDSYHARLVVDATGGFSPVASTFRLHRLYGFYSVYGAFLTGIDLKTDSIVLAYVDHLGSPPPILEVVPCGMDSAYCAVFTYSKQLVSPSVLASTFSDHCRHNPFFGFTAKAETVTVKSGSIAIGAKKRRRLPGVISVGEAGLVQPPLLGTAFNEILEYSEDICMHISQLLESIPTVPPSPSFRYPLIKYVQDRIQLEITCALMRGSVERFDRLIRFLNKLSPEIVYSFCSNKLTWSQLIQSAARFPLYMLSTGSHPRFYG
jgi:flavin-dependent dehydrogenase